MSLSIQPQLGSIQVQDMGGAVQKLHASQTQTAALIQRAVTDLQQQVCLFDHQTSMRLQST